MADGNVGSLFMTLGLKDEISIGLDKVAKKLSGAQKYTDDLQKEVGNLRKELKSASGTDISGPFKKSLEFIKKYDDGIYNAIVRTNRLAYALRGITQSKDGKININLSNIPVAIRELAKLNQELNKIEDKDDKKAFKTSISNATDYLKLLQTIERKKAELNEISLSSRNIDKGVIASARSAINSIQSEISRQLFNIQNGSIIHTDLMPNIKKLLSMSITEMGDYMRNLKKDNPLSVFVNSADMLTSKIAAANKKILEMQALMRGSKVPGLFDTSALNGLRGVVGKMQSLINKEGKGEKTDISKINRLVSEYAKLTSQAELATSTFRRMSREYDNASARLVSWFSKYRELQSIRNDRIRLGLDTSAIDAEISRVRALFSEINSIRRGLAGGDTNFLGMLGSRGTGADANIFNAVRKASREEIAAVEKIDRAIEKSYEKEKRQEQQRSEQRLKDIDREGKALQKNAEIQQRFAEQQNRLNTRMSNEVVTISSKIESLTSIYRRLTSELNRSTLLGIDTSKIQAEMSRIESQILRLVNIKKGLETGDTSYLGAHRTIGTATDRSAARSVLQEYRDLNSEKEKSIKLEARHQLEIANTAAKVRNDLARAFEQVNTRASKTSDIIRDLKSLFLQGGLVFGAQQFFNSIVRTGGEIVQQHIALRSIIGDIQKADELFAQTQQLALQSPFKFGELNRDVKQLAAFGVEANDLYDTTKRLADIASGLGVSFERLGLAYGQVKARSWLDGKELRQFAYAGLPLLERITQLYNATAKNGRTNYTQSDVKKMITNREVSFEDVKTVLWNMTNEGGQFYNMQLVLSETLLGRWNKLIDAWEIMLGKFAEGNNVIGGTFKMIIDQVTNATLALDKLSPMLVAAAAVFVGKKALGLIPMGISKELSALQTATNLELRRYAVKQQELVTEGKITQAKAMQNVMMRGYMLADKQTQMATMQKLALEGKLSLLQMQKAVREGLVKKELIQELEILGLISAKQAELIMQQGMRSTAQLAGMQAMGGIGKGASALLGAFGGPWGIAAMLGMSLWMGYSQFEDKAKESIDNLKTSAQQKFEQLNNYLNGMGSKPRDNEALKTQVDSMKEVLEQSGYYTDSIKAQVENTIKLTDQYDILKTKIEEARNASQFDKAFAGNARNAVTMSGQTDSWFGTLFGLSGKIGQITDKFGWTETGGVFGWFSGIFNDDIVKNSEHLAESINKVSSLLMTMDSKKIEEIANQFLSAGDKTKSLEEKLRILKESGSWDGFVKKIIEGGILSENEIDNIGDKADDLIDDLNEIKDDDVPKIMEELARQRNMELDEFKIWAKDHPIAFGNMLDTIMKTIGDKGPKIKELLYDAFYGFMGMSKPEEPNYNKGSYRNPIKGAFANQIKQQLFSNGSIKRGNNNGKYWVRQIDTYLQQVDKDTYQETGEAILKNYKQWRNEVDTMETSDVNKNSAKYKRAKWMLDLWDTIRKAGNLSEDVGKNKNTGNFGKDGNNQEDEELKRLRKRIELYKKFYSEYKKLQDLVGQGALDKLRKDGEFDPVFKYGLNNITDYESSVRQLLGAIPANTADRKDYKNQAIADIQTKNRELFSEQISKDNDELRTQLGIISEQYEVYKKMYKLTADSEGAMSIAFGGGMATKTYSEYLKGEMAKILPTHNKNTGLTYSLEEVLGMSQGQFDSAYGKNNSRLSVLFSQYQDELKKIKMETISMIADIIEKNSTLEQQLKDIDTEYEYQLGLLNEMKDLTPETRKRAEEGLMKTRDDKKAQVRFELFKQNSDWVAIFDDLDRVSTNTINSMIDKIDTFSKETGLSVEVVKQLRDALEKLRSKSIERNPLDALLNSTSRGNAIGKLISQNEYLFSRGKKVTIDAATAKKTGLKEGQSYTKTELENEQESAFSDFPASIAALQKKFEALSGVLNPVLDLFSALGMEDTALGQGMGLASGALSAASGAAQGLSALGLSSLGPYGATIGAGLSVVSGLFAMHDKALQKEIEASERRQKEMENMTKNIESVLESALGGIYSYKASRDTMETLKKVTKNYEVNMRLLNISSLGRIFGQSGLVYSRETYQQAVKAQQSGTAYDAELASLMAQRDELKKQRQAEEDKKKTDADAIQNYDQQIKEMEQSIDDFAQTFLNDIYSIDIKSWASQLTDSIVEAWSKGEDAATAYHDKVQELIKDLTKNILSQKIMEMALQPTLDELKDKLQQKGKLDEADIPGIADDLIKAGDNAVENITNILDALKEKGWDLSENGTLSVSNSIKNITEDTADILASYLNSIRLDCSVNRENLRLILVAVQSVPEMNNIARSQLTQLTTLVTLAEARNSKLDDMYSWMNKVTNGVLKISMK